MVRKRVKKFFATYVGKQKVISLSPNIGKVVRDVAFEVDVKMANTLRFDRNFRVEEKTMYEEDMAAEPEVKKEPEVRKIEEPEESEEE